VLAYEQKLWPHPPGLLRALVRRNLDFHWSLGSYDAERGKLRETYSAGGNRDLCDSYIDNGHPYWGMQAFAFFLIPQNDPFWAAREEPLPVERDDFRVRFDSLHMLLAGAKESGQVRWVQSLNHHAGADYRDKYTKFSYSSHFPFNILPLKDRAAWDGTLILRDVSTGECASRVGVTSGKLTQKGVVTEWWTLLRGKRVEVTTELDLEGDTETRRHTIVLPAGVEAEAVEGSYALGLQEGEDPARGAQAGRMWMRSAQSGLAVESWNDGGWQRMEAVESFDESGRKNVNAIYPRMMVITLRAKLRAGKTELASRHYAGVRQGG